jgi:hypothetical protein
MRCVGALRLNLEGILGNELFRGRVLRPYLICALPVVRRCPRGGAPPGEGWPRAAWHLAGAVVCIAIGRRIRGGGRRLDRGAAGACDCRRRQAKQAFQRIGFVRIDFRARAVSGHGIRSRPRCSWTEPSRLWSKRRGPYRQRALHVGVGFLRSPAFWRARPRCGQVKGVLGLSRRSPCSRQWRGVVFERIYECCRLERKIRSWGLRRRPSVVGRSAPGLSPSSSGPLPVR